MTSEPTAAELLGDLSDRAPLGLAVVDVRGRLAWSNPAFARLGPTPVPGAELLLPTEGPWAGVLTAVRQSVATGHPETVHDIHLDAPDKGRSRYVDIEIVPLPSRTGPASRAAMFVRDVTDTFGERERARLFYTAFLTSTNAMEATDTRGRLVDVNPAFERIYGFRREEVVGRKPNVVRSAFTPPEVYQQLWASISDPKRGFWSGELLNRDKNGRERPVFLTITAVRDPAGEITNYLGVAVDLSERRAWEQQAAHADKLASLGQLAAGVAHEINTPLANVMLVAESMRRRTTDEWTRSRLTTVTEQIEVAARIVRGLLDFARRSEPHVSALDLRVVAKEALEFVHGKRPRDIELDLQLPTAPVPVLADRGQLLQVLTNLLVNAFDAIDGKGTVRLVIQRSGESVTVEVVDSGPGIPDTVMPHIFEPFFTTKAEGKGTGLGLAICHGIVQAHHGSITASNGPAGGAVFRLTLPIHRETPEPSA